MEGKCVCNRFGKTSEICVPEYVEVVVEVPRGSFVKRSPDGVVDVVGPVPCPFNYGSVPSIPAPDGDPLDAVVLGGRLPYGYKGVWKVRGMLKFIDAGEIDNKLVCKKEVTAGKYRIPPQRTNLRTPVRESYINSSCCGDESNRVKLRDGYQGNIGWEREGGEGEKGGLCLGEFMLLTAFFRSYAVFKGVLNASRGKVGRTSFEGWEFP